MIQLNNVLNLRNGRIYNIGLLMNLMIYGDYKFEEHLFVEHLRLSKLSNL